MHLREVSIEEGHDLASGAGGIRAELVGAGTLGDTVLNRPKDCFVIIGVGFDVGEGIRSGLGLRLAVGTPLEGDNLASGTAAVRAESGGADAVGDPLFHGPQDSFVVIGVGIDICEGIICTCRLRLTLGPPEEGDHLGAGAGLVRAEQRGGGAGSDLRIVPIGPIDGLKEEGAGVLHIVKAERIDLRVVIRVLLTAAGADTIFVAVLSLWNRNIEEERTICGRLPGISTRAVSRAGRCLGYGVIVVAGTQLWKRIGGFFTAASTRTGQDASGGGRWLFRDGINIIM